MTTDILKKVWPEWQIEKQIGKGSFGIVYEAVRRDHNVESHAAIKVISIPTDTSEIDSLRSEGLSINDTKAYFKGIVNDFVSEIQLMESMKGIQNIVSVEDYKVVEKTDEIGWDIYIRMELLTPFNTYTCDKKLTESEVIKLGCDICSALEICGQRNIIHRDIKPENIFINDFGYFKLGDFGIARKLENATGGFSQKGTPNYMAPEVIRGNDYDARVDTYSLGLVLYRLMNDNRLPFLDTEKQLLNYIERKNAVDRRINGEPLPPPCNASPNMANLILRSCAFDINQRFASASDMKQALESVSNGTYQIVNIHSNLNGTVSVRPPIDDSKKEEEKSGSVGTFGKKSKLPLAIAAIAVVIVLAIAGVFAVPALINSDEKDDSPNNGTGNTINSGEIEDGKDEQDNQDETDQEQEQINSIISDAEALIAKSDYQGALDTIQDGLTSYPESEDLQAKADEYTSAIDKQIDTIVTEAEKFAANEYYEDAIEIIKTGLTTYPDSEKLESKIQEYETAYETNALTQVNQLLTENRYDEALVILDRAEQVLRDETIITKKKEETERAKFFYPLDQYEAEKDYSGAIQYMNGNASKYGDDAEFIKKLSFYQDKYREETLSLAAVTFESAGYYEAIDILNESLTILPNDSAILDKIGEYEEYEPIRLFSLSYFDAATTGFIYGPSLEKDNIGETHNDCFYLHESYWDYSSIWATYRINGEYKKIRGTYFLTFDNRTSNKERVLNIYGDDILLYTATMSNGIEPIDFDVDISGVNYLKISINPGNSKVVRLSEVYLYKK